MLEISDLLSAMRWEDGREWGGEKLKEQQKDIEVNLLLYLRVEVENSCGHVVKEGR